MFASVGIYTNVSFPIHEGNWKLQVAIHWLVSIHEISHRYHNAVWKFALGCVCTSGTKSLLQGCNM